MVPGKKVYSPWKRFKFLCSCGPVVLWPCGRVVLWSSGPLADAWEDICRDHKVGRKKKKRKEKNKTGQV